MDPLFNWPSLPKLLVKRGDFPLRLIIDNTNNQQYLVNPADIHTAPTPGPRLDFPILSTSDLQQIDLVLILGLQNVDPTKTIIANAVDAMTNNALQLNSVYRVFCESPAVKRLACERFKQRMLVLNAQYKRTKASIRAALLLPAKPQAMIGAQTWWVDKVIRLMEPDREKEYYKAPNTSPLANQPVCWLNMTGQPNWFNTMVTLSTIRKVLTERNVSSKQPVQHLTILNFDDFSLFVVNMKADRKGTTRLVWPITSPTVAEPKDVQQIRVLDLTYGQVYEVVRQIFRGTLRWDDKQLAEYMLGVLGNNQQIIQFLKSQYHQLGAGLNCSFLRGIRLERQTNCIEFFQPNWFITKQALSPKDLDRLGVLVTAHESICYILAILFLAEPRHALGMWHSTKQALELVEQGYLRFSDLFSTLNRAIKHGRLLPGANALGKVLTQAPPTPVIQYLAKRSTQDTAKTEHLRSSLVCQETLVPPMVNPCEPSKRLAMPLVDSVVKPFPEDFYWNYEAALAGHGGQPLFQPLMKVLFIEFLALVRDMAAQRYWQSDTLENLRAEATRRITPVMPEPPRQREPARRNESDKLSHPPGYIPWAVEYDNNSLFRVLALALEQDEERHGAYRLKVAWGLIDALRDAKHLTGGLKIAILKSLLADLNLSPRNLDELRQLIQGYGRPEQAVLFLGAKNIPVLHNTEVCRFVLEYFANTCQINIDFFRLPSSSNEQVLYSHILGKNPTRTITIVCTAQNYYYLLQKEGEPLVVQQAFLRDSVEIQEEEDPDPDYVEGEAWYNEDMPDVDDW